MSTARYDVEAEQAVLGAVLLGGAEVLARVLEEGLHEKDFHQSAHRAVFGAMLAMREDGEPIDPLTLRDRLERTGQLEEAGGRAGVDLLAGAVPTIANFRTYARIVVRLSCWRVRRRLLLGALAKVDGEDEQGYRDVLGRMRKAELHYRGHLEREVTVP